jgi:hypothetical protein
MTDQPVRQDLDPAGPGREVGREHQRSGLALLTFQALPGFLSTSAS